jgi:hypothetical protein
MLRPSSIDASPAFTASRKATSSGVSSSGLGFGCAIGRRIPRAADRPKLPPEDITEINDRRASRPGDDD